MESQGGGTVDVDVYRYSDSAPDLTRNQVDVILHVSSRVCCRILAWYTLIRGRHYLDLRTTSRSRTSAARLHRNENRTVIATQKWGRGVSVVADVRCGGLGCGLVMGLAGG